MPTVAFIILRRTGGVRIYACRRIQRVTRGLPASWWRRPSPDMHDGPLTRQTRCKKGLRPSDRKPHIFDEAATRFPDNLSLKMHKWSLLLTRFHNYDAAYAVGRELVENNFDDSMLLNTIAWSIADTEGLEVRDLDLAMKAAAQANNLTGSEDAAILDTLARVYFEKGDLESAVKWQKLAVKFADAGATGDSIRAVLEKYQKMADRKGKGVVLRR